MKRIVIVGGGVTGLSAAFFLRARARVTLLEAGPRLGGVVATERADGFLVEGGPEGFPAGAGELRALCRRLGLEIATARGSRRYVWCGGRARRLSWRDGLLSWKGRFRAALDLVLPSGPSAGDESVGAYLRRRMGDEVFERVAGPVLSGIYLASPDDLSLRSVFPGLFRGGGRASRSLLFGWRRVGEQFGPRLTLRFGMYALVEGLRSSLGDVEIRLRARVDGIEPSWKVHVSGEILEADAVILALPAPRAAEAVRRFSPALAGLLSGLRSVSCATVALGFPRRPPVPATSLFFAPPGGNPLAALTFPSEKFEGRAPEGCWLVRAFLRGAPPGAARLVREELRRLFGVLEEPVLERAYLWPEGRPVHEVGHRDRLREIERLLPPGLHLAGASYGGVSLEECLRDARRAADRAAGAGPGDGGET